MTQATPYILDLVAAHNILCSAIHCEPPPRYTGLCMDHQNLQVYHQHLHRVLEATLAYTQAVVAELQYFSPISINADTELLGDAIRDVTGSITQAADRLEEAA